MFNLLFVVLWVLVTPSSGDQTITGAIVHLMEWKYDDIAAECPFLGKHRFGAVLISPPTENAVVSPNRPWNERYQVISYKLVTRSGNEDELKRMIRVCAEHRVRIIVDIVLNNMAHSKVRKAVGTGGSEAEPAAYKYPDFTQKHFHEYCTVVVYQNSQQLRTCEVANLSDLDQSQPRVRRLQVELMNKLLDMGVAGFMVDKAKFMWPEDLAIHQTRLHDIKWATEPSRPVMFYNVDDPGTNEAARWDQYNSLGKVTDYLYGWELASYFFTKKNFVNIIMKGTLRPWWMPVEDSLVFLTNVYTHSEKIPNRIRYKQNPEAYKIATAIMMGLRHGQPLILSSYELETSDSGPPADGQGNILSSITCEGAWNCEHRVPEVYKMAYFYDNVKDEEVTGKFMGGNYKVAFTRGTKGFLAINFEDTPWSHTFQTTMPEGEYCELLTGGLGQDGSSSCDELAARIKVDDKGTFLMEIPPKTFRAIHSWNKIGYVPGPKEPQIQNKGFFDKFLDMFDVSGISRSRSSMQIPTATLPGNTGAGTG